MSHRRPGLWALAFMVSACGAEPCRDEPTSFQLDLSVEDPALADRVEALLVRLQLLGRSYSRSYPLTDELLDGETALAVDLEPAPTENFELTVSVQAQAGDLTLARGEQTFRASPNGCNRFALALATAPPGGDGGPADLQTDALRPDLPGPDAGPVELGPNDGAGEDAGDLPPEPPCAVRARDDDVLLYSFDEVPAFTTTVADARERHPGVARPEGAIIDRAPSREDCGLAIRFTDGSYLEVASSEEFNLSSGSLDFWVSASPAVDRQGMEGLVSRDASGTANPGHIGIYRNCEGYLMVRMQRTGAPDVYRCSDRPLPAGQWFHVGLNFGAPEVELYVDGTLSTNTSTTTVRWNCSTPVPCGAPSTYGIDGNENPLVLGTSTHNSAEGLATPVSAPFRGLIDSFRLSRSRRSFQAPR